MARYIKDIVLNQPEDFVAFMMNDYLEKNSFVLKTWKGAPAYISGAPFIEKYRIMTWSYTNGVLHLEACLGNFFGGEMDLRGVYGIVIKSTYRREIERLVTLLKQPVLNASDFSESTIVTFQATDNSGAATISMVLGIIYLCLFWIPLVFLFLGVISVWTPLVYILLGAINGIFYRAGQNSSKSGRATVGFICSIIGINLAMLIYFVHIVLVFMNFTSRLISLYYACIFLRPML